MRGVQAPVKVLPIVPWSSQAETLWSTRSLAAGLSRVVPPRSEEHTSELQSLRHLVCRLLLEKKKSHTEPRASVVILSASEASRRATAWRLARWVTNLEAWRWNRMYHDPRAVLVDHTNIIRNT